MFNLEKIIARDKLIHHEICSDIALFGYPLIGWWAFLLAFAAGVGKELWDLKRYGLFSWGDILADITGEIKALIVTLLFKTISL